MMREDLMVQQQVESVWQHMVGVICLNQTSRIQVKRVLPVLFDSCPTPEILLKTSPKLIKEIIKPLGMVNVREKRIRQMSKDFLTWDGNDATMLYGIGNHLNSLFGEKAVSNLHYFNLFAHIGQVFDSGKWLNVSSFSTIDPCIFLITLIMLWSCLESLNPAC